MEVVKLSRAEEFTFESGWQGLTGMDAVKALRGATRAGTVEERVLHAIGTVQTGQPGAKFEALDALNLALDEIKKKAE